MQRILITVFTIICILAFTSCEGCTKNVTKKATEITLSAVEGVAEAVDNHGDKVGEKLTDATGKLAQGVGRSLDRQLNEHATKVASLSGRTLVQALDGVISGAEMESRKTYYKEVPYKDNICDGVVIDYIGIMKTSPILDIYLKITSTGTYNCQLKVYDKKNNPLLTKNAETKNDIKNNSVMISFALDDSELNILNNSENRSEISITK